MEDQFIFNCPVPHCRYYQDSSNTVTKAGFYTVQSESRRRQRFDCYGGNHSFSETAYSELYGKHGSFKEYTQAAKMTARGLSSEAISDVLEKDERTIIDWQEAIAHKAKGFHVWFSLIYGLSITVLQMDELWSYLCSKTKQLWVFAALDVPTRFLISFQLGSRTTHMAKRLVAEVVRLGHWEELSVLKVSTDKLAAYKNALEALMKDLPYVYLQIVKKRWKRRLRTVKKCFVKGSEVDFPPGTQNTSYIERFNLTLRQGVSYLQRKTLGYCKNKVFFERVMWINLFDYNYKQFHKSLRIPINKGKEKFKKHYQHRTPAMAMGITKNAIDWQFLILFPIPITN